MELTVFAKKRVTREGKTFYNYLSTVKKAGEEITVQLKFKEACGQPKAEECPLNILLDKKDANFTSKTIHVKDDETGEEKEYSKNVIWISDWKIGSEYVDHSMDDIE